MVFLYFFLFPTIMRSTTFNAFNVCYSKILCGHIVGISYIGLWIFVELRFPTMDSSFVSFVKKAYRLCFSNFRFVVVVLCSVYFLTFSESYHLPFIFAVILYYGMNMLNNRSD
jgi:hypothetical protein